ncbi:uncharacterized protein LOC124717148 isoform X1 [Schistocerca piceifrons]|uniref:uncharacterized protein LOC124717148 isoform X1 n=2 Tax=Schistocerca piceifrons TaxID=274613 RepID=UPI001F5EDA63|nr:uncharacterized protein LOC124717148 isoform X1 [Schistocerca piceifrons]
MSSAAPVPVHGMNLQGNNDMNLDPSKEYICEDTAPLKDNICIDVEAQSYNRTLKKKMEDPAALMRQRIWELIHCFTDASPWAYALSFATLFTVPLMHCVDLQCMERCLPVSVCNLWYTKVVVIISLIITNLLLAVLLSVKSELVKLFSVLNYTLLAVYYVLAFLLYVAIEPYDTHLALHMICVTLALAYPSWVLSRSMTKKPKVRIVYVTRA